MGTEKRARSQHSLNEQLIRPPLSNWQDGGEPCHFTRQSSTRLDSARVILHPGSKYVSPSLAQINGGVLTRETHRLAQVRQGHQGRVGKHYGSHIFGKTRDDAVILCSPCKNWSALNSNTSSQKSRPTPQRLKVQTDECLGGGSFKTNMAEFQLTLIFTRAASTPPGCPAMDTCSQ